MNCRFSVLFSVAWRSTFLFYVFMTLIACELTERLENDSRILRSNFWISTLRWSVLALKKINIRFNVLEHLLKLVNCSWDVLSNLLFICSELMWEGLTRRTSLLYPHVDRMFCWRFHELYTVNKIVHILLFKVRKTFLSV